MAKLKRPEGLSNEQWLVLQAALRARNRKTNRVTLQALYKACPGSLTEVSVVKKVGKLIHGGFLEQEDRGLYKVLGG